MLNFISSDFLLRMEPVIIFIFLGICGILIRWSLIFTNQMWAKTYQHAATYILLPIIAYVITTTIANNIALSLGMIGALSIVRFRHPVRSHFELTLFFAMITLGIAAGVNYKFAVLLEIAIVLTILCLYYFQILLKKDLYIPSFTEGDIFNYIEIETNEKIDFLTDNKFLKNLNCDISKNEFKYVLSFNDRQSLDKFIIKIENNTSIINYKVIINENNI